MHGKKKTLLRTVFPCPYGERTIKNYIMSYERGKNYIEMLSDTDGDILEMCQAVSALTLSLGSIDDEGRSGWIYSESERDDAIMLLHYISEDLQAEIRERLNAKHS